MRTINIHVEMRNNQPAIWEAGGGKSRTGWAQVVAGADGAPKRPLLIRRSGSLALGNHALVPVDCGDYIVWARRGGEQPEIEVAVVGNIDKSTALEAAVEAAEKKAACYHCRGPHFIEE